MILYHGSNVQVAVPDLAHSKPFKDFGRGFYLSSDEQQAWELATQKVEQLHSGKPIVSAFLFDETLMDGKELRVKRFEDYSEEWAMFVLDNRNEKFPHYCLEWAEFVWNNRDENQNFHHDYDIVYGPIADDGVNYQLRRYRGGVISLQRLVEELRYAKGITFQYYFGSERALLQLTSL